MAKNRKSLIWILAAVILVVLAVSWWGMLSKGIGDEISTEQSSTPKIAITTEKPKSNPIIINIQPLDNFNSSESVVKGLKSYLADLGILNVEINVLPKKKSPSSAEIERYNPQVSDKGYRYTRLRADSLIKWLHDGKKDVYNIGITNRDVSCTVHGVNDFGVLGLSYLNHKYNGVAVSTFRLRNKDEIWKVAAHEFTHCFFSMVHCKANDPHCIMQNANKHPNFSIKEKLCDKCKDQVKPILQKL